MRDFFSKRLQSGDRDCLPGRVLQEHSSRLSFSTWRFQILPCALSLAVLGGVTVIRADDALPTGFKAERYRSLWERNPFTLVTPAAPTQSQTFNKLVVVSWMNAGGKDTLFVQDTDTNDVVKVTDVPNDKGLRIVEVHAQGGKDFQMIRDFEAVISNGSEQGAIKFKPQESAPMVASNPMNPMQIPPQVGQNGQIPQQLQGQMQQQGQAPGVNVQPTAPYANQNVPPQTQQTRRKRVLPSAVANGPPGAVPQSQQNPEINRGPNGQ